MAAASAAGIGLAALVTLTIAGWVAAPHDAFADEIAELLQGAVLAWLVGHLVPFGTEGAQISLLPLGLVLLPGILLYRSGRWLARNCEIARLRHVHRAAVAIAGPYAAIAGTLALLARTEAVEPNMLWALVMGFSIAFVAGGLGVLRQLMRDKQVGVGALLDLMPPRARSLLVGALASTGTLALGGVLLFLTAMAVSLPEVIDTTRALGPGIVGGVLLVIVQLAYLPNAIVYAVCYALGPGFALGEMTVVAPTGVSVGPLPLFPMLAALPENGPAPVLSLGALAVPFIAGALGGVLTQRSAPDVVSEAAPLWGFVCGITTGITVAAFALVTGGSLGAVRLAEVGPSAWQVGLVAALEVGVAAAVAAWIANWWYSRKLRLAGGEPGSPRARETARGSRAPEPSGPSGPSQAGGLAVAETSLSVPKGEGLATVTALRPREEDEGARQETASVRTTEAAPEDAPEAPPESSTQERREARRRNRDVYRSDRAAERAARREAREELRAHRRAEKAERPSRGEIRAQRRSDKAERRAQGERWWRRRPTEDDGEGDELFGITYEAGDQPKE
uniref:cell division protein PerM n=1 Tax=Nocardiopsis salina TaxID=245836 RepID=UPI00035C6304